MRSVPGMIPDANAAPTHRAWHQPDTSTVAALTSRHFSRRACLGITSEVIIPARRSGWIPHSAILFSNSSNGDTATGTATSSATLLPACGSKERVTQYGRRRRLRAHRAIIGGQGTRKVERRAHWIQGHFFLVRNSIMKMTYYFGTSHTARIHFAFSNFPFFIVFFLSVLLPLHSYSLFAARFPLFPLSLLSFSSQLSFLLSMLPRLGTIGCLRSSCTSTLSLTSSLHETFITFFYYLFWV